MSIITNTANSLIRYSFENYSSGYCVVKNARQNAILFNSADYLLAIENFSIYNPLMFVNVSKILFETSLIPVSQVNLSSDLSITRQQIGEYIITNADRSSSFISFTATNYNWYTMNSQDELTNLDLYINLLFLDGTTQIVQVNSPNTNSFNCTILFKRVK